MCDGWWKWPDGWPARPKPRPPHICRATKRSDGRAFLTSTDQDSCKGALVLNGMRSKSEAGAYYCMWPERAQIEALGVAMGYGRPVCMQG